MFLFFLFNAIVDIVSFHRWASATALSLLHTSSDFSVVSNWGTIQKEHPINRQCYTVSINILNSMNLSFI
jgi:hypothetical protein